MTASPAERLAELPEDERLELLAALPETDQDALLADWQFWARPEQLTPEGQWTVWAIISGRGFGKTRSGAEFVLDRAVRFAEHKARHRVALVGRTAADCRDTMVEGDSGLAACAERRGIRLVYTPSKRRVDLPDLGTTMTTFSDEAPKSLRGPQHHTGWCDEPGAWSHRVDAEGNTAWTNLMFGLRLDPPAGSGLVPQVCATTTPKPIPLIVGWFRAAGLHPDEDGSTRDPDPTLVLTRGALYDNVANLAPAFVALITGQYGDTRLGAQEIHGALLTAVEGALWRPVDVEPGRLLRAPQLGVVVVAVDPPGSATGAECGIIVAGADAGPGTAALPAGLDPDTARVRAVLERHAYIIDDASVRGRPEDWAAAAVTAYRRHAANYIVAETNYGGDMVRAAIHAVDPTVPVRVIHASRGKAIRAEPVALLYQRRRVHHVGYYGLLESQMFTWVPGPGQVSPDRMDALVWAVSALLDVVGQVPGRSASAAGERVGTGADAARRRLGTSGGVSAVRLPGAGRQR